MFRDKLKKIFQHDNNEQEGNDKKKIENIVFFIIVLVITIVIMNAIWNGNKQSTKKDENISTKYLATENEDMESVEITDQEELEKKLENILSKIEGVGNVNVCINYSESSEVIAMFNENSKVSTTEETDTSGGIRKIQQTDSQKDIIYKEDNGEKTPITKKIIQPKIEGAIITANGANNASTKANIIQAIEAVTGLPTHKIQVFEMN